jgi:D-alanyl-D-alanine carboxypeptidase (penicillin-binding protein 5/6)
LIEPDPSLRVTKVDPATDPAAAQNVAAELPPADATPVRVGVGVVGAVVVFGLIMAARSLNRRPLG